MAKVILQNAYTRATELSQLAVCQEDVLSVRDCYVGFPDGLELASTRSPSCKFIPLWPYCNGGSLNVV
jgi:hypothetical protein